MRSPAQYPMLRYGLLGGARPPLPWEFFVSTGGGALGAGALFAVWFPLWSSDPWAGLVELAGFVVLGTTLIVVGARRKSRSRRRP